jgi:hypothetical protein
MKIQRKHCRVHHGRKYCKQLAEWRSRILSLWKFQRNCEITCLVRIFEGGGGANLAKIVFLDMKSYRLFKILSVLSFLLAPPIFNLSLAFFIPSRIFNSMKDDVPDLSNIESAERTIEENHLRISFRARVCSLTFILWSITGSPGERGWVSIIPRGAGSVRRYSSSLKQPYLDGLPIKTRTLVHLIFLFPFFDVFATFLLSAAPLSSVISWMISVSWSSRTLSSFQIYGIWTSLFSGWRTANCHPQPWRPI